MSSAIREWLNLSVRWFHVFAGIMWVGQTYYFNLARPANSQSSRKKPDSNATLQKFGWFTAEAFTPSKKQESLSVAPEQVRWFRWEALMTVVAGVILLVLVYYLGDGLINPDVADISKAAGIRLVYASMIAGI